MYVHPDGLETHHGISSYMVIMKTEKPPFRVLKAWSVPATQVSRTGRVISKFGLWHAQTPGLFEP